MRLVRKQRASDWWGYPRAWRHETPRANRMRVRLVMALAVATFRWWYRWGARS